MKNRQTLAATLLCLGIVAGGAGTAAAQYGGDAEPAQTETSLVQVQATDDATDGESRRGRGCGQKHEAAAAALGLTVEELQTELDSGLSIADVAADEGIDIQDVIDAMVAQVEAKLDAKVDEGRLSADEAAEKLAEKTERIGEKVNEVRPASTDTDLNA